ncbi:MAG: SpoIID/LytB domain-containing protein [Okeania sp. SIO3B5]|uniref:SpoIID/LytB domain-containing protein n=1 Tax=Okeania sp. SIO3B5 TaxID=2607811 RepID=UPI00140199BB|nr:SpoIID/LytB domain-containing protein [Okeania sp. SIO3B5]NEO56248.1 SpoIID/LytB domain-containing protein [Okeania sp. SIO3B5]
MQTKIYQKYFTHKLIPSTILITTLLLGLYKIPVEALEESNKLLKIGVIQRFGTKPTDKITLRATPGDKLTLSFKTPAGEETLTTEKVELKIKMRPQEKALLKERLVLSSHRSYENAEEDAQLWKDKGIKVEVTQPGRWKVWAKREVYKTPLLRRWLLESLQAHSNTDVYLDLEVLKQRPTAYWEMNGYTYHRHELDITAGKDIILVNNQFNQDTAIPEERRYGGSLKLQPNAYGSYTLVNNVPIETYIRGVVPHELGAWPPKASLEAQAILARTYALRNLHRFVADNYELCANTHCQVYKGLDVYPETDEAVAATRGKVLTYEDELIDAVYFAVSGGVTADFNDLWNGTERPYLRPVVDSANNIWDLSTNSLADEQNFRKFMSLKKGFNEEGWIEFRWREVVSLPGIVGYLKSYFREKKSPFAQIKAVKNVEVTERSLAGRVLKMTVETDKGIIELNKDEVQNAFWVPWSTLFYLDPIYKPDKTLWGYSFVGGGFGHGVGFSQKGSIKLAELGWSSDQILSFYFPGTEIQPLSESVTFGQK